MKKRAFISFEDMPIANYLLSKEELPDYLEYWLRLKDVNDIRTYVKTRREMTSKVQQERADRGALFESADYGISETQRFYAELKKKLR